MDDITPQTLPPHTYPLWIKIGVITSFTFLCISLTKMPYYFEINTKIKNARKACEENNYSIARVQYSELLLLLPNSKQMKIRAAESFFKSSQTDDHIIALYLLENIQLNNSEWTKLLCYMPEQYTEMFTSKKGRRS